MERIYRVLSIDGGGIRGLLPALVLAELEKLTGHPTADLFDLIVGTGSGGFLALGLTVPGPEGRPRTAAADLAELLLQQRSRIFQREIWDELRHPGGLSEERYASSGLEEVLREHFLETRLREACAEVMVTAYDLEKRDPFFFRSRRARAEARWDGPMWLAARAAMATPTYFEPVLVRWPDRDRDVLVDGALFAANPGLCAYAEARTAMREGRTAATDLLLVSLGAGRLARPFAFEEAKDWGPEAWARPALEVAFDGQADAADHQLESILAPEAEDPRRYYRFQVALDQDLDDLDNITPANMEGLQRMARRLLAAQGRELAELASRLREAAG